MDIMGTSIRREDLQFRICMYDKYTSWFVGDAIDSYPSSSGWDDFVRKRLDW